MNTYMYILDIILCILKLDEFFLEICEHIINNKSVIVSDENIPDSLSTLINEFDINNVFDNNESSVTEMFDLANVPFSEGI